MKRLLMTMAMLVMCGATAAPAFAQSKDLAGTWAIDLEKSGKDGIPMVVITLTDKEFTARLGSATARLMTFKVDGTESELSQGIKGKASWNGNKFEATVITPKGPETVTFSREGAWLVLDVKADEGPRKLYFKKIPAGL